ncbi:MAG: hypothetical protein E6G92_10915 [Alphaproteobacteria bacterium]|nr:MAG: hypothetical protein E6G92_10915 [Alphaproteobacteria bacterium]
MRFGLAIIAATSFACYAPAFAQADSIVALTPGQSAVLTVAGKGEARVVQRGRGEWTPHDLAAARHLVGRPIPDAPVPEASPLPSAPASAPPPPVARDAVHLRFMSIAGRHSLLIVENGYGAALLYRARMTRDGQTRPTDVCVVLPSNRSYEHWPHPIDRLELTDFALVPWNEGDPATCE